MAFPDSFIQDLKMRNDITDVVSGYVSLKRSGRNLVGLCPFHGEKTPSFNVYTENGSFYCFGCGVGGDVITFVMRIENLDYVEAVRFLAQRAGLEMPDSGYDDSMSKLRMRVFEANREAARFFYEYLYSPGGKSGLDYFHSRGLTDRTIRHFGLGYADDEWTSLCKYLKSKGFKDSELVAANLAVRRKNGSGVYDRFTDRVMFPIIDLRGNVVAFGGRILTDAKPKYLNTSDTPVFKKSANLFSLNNAKKSGERSLILCEGYMDVISVNQAGVTNAVATLGTALTNEQAMLMKRYAAEVVICYDSDAAGRKAASRAIPILRNCGLKVKVLAVPGSKDPDEYIKSNGKDGPAAFRALVNKSINDVEYRLQKLKAQYNTDTSEGAVAFLEAAAKLVAEIDSPIERGVYSDRLCREFNMPIERFDEQVNRLLKKGARTREKNRLRQIQIELGGRNDKTDSERSQKPRSTVAEEGLLVYLIHNPDTYGEISKRVAPEKFRNSLVRRFYEYVCGRVKNGLDPLTSVSADFTPDETSWLFRLTSRPILRASSEKTMNEYISVINEEYEKQKFSDMEDKSSDDILEYLDALKKKKQ